MRWRLERLLELPENWDSYGAKKVSRPCAEIANHLLDMFPADHLCALNDGGVSLCELSREKGITCSVS